MNRSHRWWGLLKISVVLLAIPVLAGAQTIGFHDFFDIASDLEESGSISDSTSPNWWLNSGGRFIEGDSVGKTVQGELPTLDRWRLEYLVANPVDTDNGYHPQNIFRLIQRQLWTNFRQRVYFYIHKTNLSASPNRNGSNGILLFNRYLDSQNLYYVGVRVDGAAVIKKKVGGLYFTLAYSKIFPGSYDPTSNPNLLPENQWLGIRSRLHTNTDGSVTVQLWLDRVDGAGWQLVLEAIDTGTLGGPPITIPGFAGIRTDFMDVDFQSYRVHSRL